MSTPGEIIGGLEDLVCPGPTGNNKKKYNNSNYLFFIGL
jgi:hypothetical protein